MGVEAIVGKTTFLNDWTGVDISPNQEPPLGKELFDRFNTEAEIYKERLMGGVLTGGKTGNITAIAKEFTAYFFEEVILKDFASNEDFGVDTIWELYWAGKAIMKTKHQNPGTGIDMLRHMVLSLSGHYVSKVTRPTQKELNITRGGTGRNLGKMRALAGV